MSKTLKAYELYEHIEDSGITLCRTNKDFEGIPAGTKLWFGVAGQCLSPFDMHTEGRNKKNGYDFYYKWRSCWHDRYNGKFEVIESDGKIGQHT